MIRRIRRFAEDRGVALPIVAMLLVVMIGMAAFAVDLGWLYLQGSRIQRGADAAALAGVVHLPANTNEVDAQTVNGANANGWDIGELNGVGVPGGGNDILNWDALAENKLRVELTATVPTFFMRVFGIDEVTMTRRATAEYIKPVPLGSPSACFGIGQFAANISPTNAQSLENQSLAHCRAYNMNFWAAINGPLTAKEHGDPYAVACIVGTGCNTASPTNPDYRPGGYYYGIEIPPNKTSFTVKIFDAAFYDRGCQTETGDCDGLANSVNGGMTTHYTLYRWDDTPLNPFDNTQTECPTRSYAAETNSPNTRNQWVSICTVNNPAAGAIYVLNVRSTGNTGGNNSYSIGVTTNGGNTSQHARVYAINDMSIFTNSGGASVATVYLAEVDPVHAGKTLLLDFYDPGENPSGNAWVEVRTPTDGSSTCSWVSRNDGGGVTGSGTNVNPCRLQSTVSGTAQFNAQWLSQSIAIPGPATYSCGTTCYWTMRLELGTTSQDRTTWAARIVGNPVRLVPN